MSSWEGFTTLVAGLLAVILLSSCITLANSRGDQALGRTLKMLSTAGLAATALFGIGLAYHLMIELWVALHLLS